MADQAKPPTGITILGMLHVITGSLAGLALLVKLVRGVAGGIPLFLLVWIALATFLGPGLGLALRRGRSWSWHLASFGYVCVAIAGAVAVPALLDTVDRVQLTSQLTRTVTIGVIALSALAAVYLFTGSVADHFGVSRRTRWAPLALEVLLAAGLVFGIPYLLGLEMGDGEDQSVLLQTMGDRRANAPEDIELMLDRLDNGSMDERVSAAWALGRSGRGDVIPQLLEASRDDRDLNVRINAIDAAATLGGGEILDDLIGFLSDGKPEIQLATLRGLADPKFVGAVEAVGHLLVENEDLRSAAVDVLGNLGSPDAVPFLVQAAGDPEEDVRSRVAHALGKLGDASAVPALIEMLQDQRWPVRANAAQSLGNLGESSARPALEQMRADPNEHARNAADAALQKLP